MSKLLHAIAENEARVPHRLQPQTKGGWQQIVRTEPFQCERLSHNEYMKLSRTERDQHDRNRMQYHSGIDAISTTSFNGAQNALGERFDAITGNGHVALPGMLLTGPASVGKSTALIRFTRDVERAFRLARKIPLPAENDAVARLENGNEYLPVCYFSLDTQVVPTLKNAVRFYNPDLPVHKRYTANDLTAILLEFIANCGTRLIAMDQMQNLKHAVAGAQAVSEALKNIMDGAPGTMLAGAGVELDAYRVFTEGYRDQDAHLAQTGSRFSLHHMNAYDIDTSAGRQDWLRLLSTIEQSFILFKTEPGDLVNNARYLHEVTGGLPGELLPVLRNAANKAIISNSERLTITVLEEAHKAARRDGQINAINLAAKQPVLKTRAPRKTRAHSHIQTSPAPATT